MFPQGTPGWGRIRSETSLDAGECVSSLMLQIDLGDSKALKELQSPLFFCRDFGLWTWLEKKDTNSGQGWTSLGPRWLWVEFHPPGFTVRCWCNSQATFEEAKEERDFGQRVVWSKAHGIHTGQDETRVITCFFALSVPWHFYSWEQYMEIVRGIGGAPGTWCSWW